MSLTAEPDSLVEVHISAPDAGVAATIGRHLVDARVAACAQVIPGVTSIYRWEGAVREDGEAMLLVKTTTGRLAALQDMVRAEHPYDTPEIIAVPVVGADPDYQAWVRSEVAPSAS